MGWTFHLLAHIAVFSSLMSSLVNASCIAKGNTIESRRNYIDKGGKKAWVDMNPENSLPAGILSEYHVFIHDVPSNVLKAYTRLQIWRSVSTHKYKLIWEKRVQFNEGYRRYMYKVQDEEVDVRNGDHIGWTFEADEGPITFTRVAHTLKKTAFAQYTDPLTVGEELTFNTVPYPGVFSVAVVVYENPCTPTYVGPKPLKQESDIYYDKEQATYMDTSIELKNGTLGSLMFYAQDLASPTNENETVDISFHVFRPVDEKFMIVWNLDYTLTDGMGRQYEINLDDKTAPAVLDGDFIGWTYKQKFTFISYKFESGAFTYQHRFPSVGVGETVKFNDLRLPYKHMVAATIGVPCNKVDMTTCKGVSPTYIPPPPRTTTTTTTPPTTTVTDEIALSTTKPTKPLPNWFPYAIIGVAIFIVIIIIVFLLLYLRDRNYRRTRYDLYDVKFNKNKGHARHYEYPSAEIAFPTSVGLSGYKHDLNYYLDVPEYDANNFQNFTVQLGSDGGRQVHDNTGFMAEAIVHNGNQEPPVAKNNNTFANGSAHAHSEEIEQIQHI